MEIDLTAYLFTPDEPWMAEHKRRGAQIKTDLDAWKAHLIQVLNDSPSEERKLVRWRVSERYTPYDASECNLVVVESGEMEVFPETSL